MTKTLTQLSKKVLFIFVISIFTFIFFTSITKVYAQTSEPDDDICSLAGAIYDWGLLGEAARAVTLSFCTVRDAIETISNPSTVLDTIVSTLLVAPYYVLFNSNAEQLSMCAVYFMGETIVGETSSGGECSDSLRSFLNDNDGSETDIASQELIDAAEEYAANGGCNFNSIIGIGDPLSSTNQGVRRARGSLVGVTQVALATVMTESPPINLAYFAKHTASKIPIINQTAFAQSTAEYHYSWGLAIIIGFWEKVRDLSLALISVIMLVIGFLIIMRSKIGPQTAVTVQYAIPRIIMSLFLIAFSYPIGAFFVNAILPLTFVGIRLLLPSSQEITDLIVHLPIVLIMNLAINLTTFGAGAIVSNLLAVIALLGVILSLLVVVVKLIIIQTKMLISIVISPIIFALGALPGQEDMIKNWFKQMIAKMISVPATIFVLFFGILMFITPYFDCDVLVSMLNSLLPEVSGPMADPTQIAFFIIGWRSNLMTLTMLPIISTIVIFSSIGIDKKITEMIVGQPKKR